MLLDVTCVTCAKWVAEFAGVFAGGSSSLFASHATCVEISSVLPFLIFQRDYGCVDFAHR